MIWQQKYFSIIGWSIMSIPSSFIDQLIDQADIVEVVGRRLQLNKKGSNFWCQCPFHDDSNPSMAVNQDKQFFYCFVCQESGNAIHFLRKYETYQQYAKYRQIKKDPTKSTTPDSTRHLPRSTYQLKLTSKTNNVPQHKFPKFPMYPNISF